MLSYFKTDLEVITFTGEKAAVLLNGQLTNDIKNLGLGHGNYNLLLNLKGKVIADAHVIYTNEGFKLLASQELIPVLFNHFQKLAPLSKVTLTASENKSIFHVQNSSIPSLLQVGECAPVPEIGALCFRSDRLGLPGVDVIGGFMIKNGRELTQLEVEESRIENGIPKIGVDVTDENLPQEGRLEAALNFKKGCYLGQEIIARLHYKGHVNKTLTGLVIEGATVPAAGEAVYVVEKEVGKITSVVFSPTLKAVLALAYLPARGDFMEGPFVVGDQKISARRVKLPIS